MYIYVYKYMCFIFAKTLWNFTTNVSPKNKDIILHNYNSIIILKKFNMGTLRNT